MPFSVCRLSVKNFDEASSSRSSRKRIEANPLAHDVQQSKKETREFLCIVIGLWVLVVASYIYRITPSPTQQTSFQPA